MENSCDMEKNISGRDSLSIAALKRMIYTSYDEITSENSDKKYPSISKTVYTELRISIISDLRKIANTVCAALDGIKTVQIKLLFDCSDVLKSYGIIVTKKKKDFFFSSRGFGLVLRDVFQNCCGHQLRYEESFIDLIQSVVEERCKLKIKKSLLAMLHTKRTTYIVDDIFFVKKMNEVH